MPTMHTDIMSRFIPMILPSTNGHGVTLDAMPCGLRYHCPAFEDVAGDTVDLRATMGGKVHLLRFRIAFGRGFSVKQI